MKAVQRPSALNDSTRLPRAGVAEAADRAVTSSVLPVGTV